MNGNRLFIDTNILIYILNGNDNLVNLLEGYQLYISFITEIELLCFYNTNFEREIINKFLNLFTIVNINEEIKSNTIKLKIKIPDAIIASSAEFLQIPLITADKGFSKLKNIEVIIFDHPN